MPLTVEPRPEKSEEFLFQPQDVEPELADEPRPAPAKRRAKPRRQERYEEEEPPRKRRSLGSLFRQLAVAALIMGAGVAFFVYRGNHKRALAESLKSARDAALPDNPADLDKALRQVQDALAVDAHSSDALALATDLETELWLTHQVPGAEAKAREYLAAAEVSGKDLGDRYGSQALQLVADGKAAEAEALVDGLRKKGASSSKLWFGLASAYGALGNLTLENEAYVQSVDKAWKSPRYAAAYAEALIDQGRLDQAIEQAQKGLTNNPDHLRSQLALALARARKKDHVTDAADAVRDALARGAELTPGLRVRALAASAELKLFDHNADDALKAANEALSIDGNSHLALWEKARALAAKKDPAALKTFEEATRLRKTGVAIYFDGAEALAASGDTKGALALLSDYVRAFQGVTFETTDGKSQPWLEHDSRYWLERGDILRLSGRADEALAAYDKGIAAGGMDLGKAHFAKGLVYLSKKAYDKAGAELALVTPPDGTGTMPEAYMAMGDILFAKKDYPGAYQNFAYALAAMKNVQKRPREKLNSVLNDVHKRLVAVHKPALAKQWMKEAKPIIL